MTPDDKLQTLDTSLQTLHTGNWSLDPRPFTSKRCPILQLRGVTAGYGNIQALKGVTLDVGRGQIVALLGANGAGKTTTLMTICGVVPPSGGEILLDGVPIQGMAPDRIVARGISQVPEGRRIFAGLTVMENLDMGAFLRKDGGETKEDLEYVFGLFPVLAERRRQAGGTLSGGEQQMLAISRALMARPRLLLLDEPSLGLAPIVVERILGIISRVNRDHGTSILLVEQNAALALSVAHRGYVMERGAIVLADSAESLAANEEVKRAYLGP